MQESIRTLVGDRHQGTVQTIRPASEAALQMSNLIRAALQLYDSDLNFVHCAEQPIEILQAISQLLVDPAPRNLRIASAETIARFLLWRPVSGADGKRLDISDTAA
jgi:hypothetical protein